MCMAPSKQVSDINGFHIFIASDLKKLWSIEVHTLHEKLGQKSRIYDVAWSIHDIIGNQIKKNS